MSYLKNLFSKTSETFRKLIKKFPITLFVIVITTLFIAIDMEQKIEIFDKIMFFCAVFSVEAFFTEACIYKKKSYRIISYVVSAIIAIGFTVLILRDTNISYEDSIRRSLVGYLIILFLISIYKIIKEKDVTFKEYMLKVFANMFNSTITYLVLNLGLTLITVIFVELLLDSWGHTLGKIQILLLGLFYIPALINSVWNVKEKDVNVFFKGLVKFVLLPLVSISMLIIYIYIIKILVLRQMPSNVIFRILAGIFVVGFLVWNMAENFKDDNKVIEKVVKLLPYFYMPFILLEIYSLFTRIGEFGITPVRYFGILFIIMQIIALALTVIKKGEKLANVFIYMAILAGIAFILPLNYSKVSILSQVSIIKSEFPENLEFENLSRESKSKVSGAYRYLIRNDAEAYVPDYIKQYKDEILDGYYYERNEYVYVHQQADEIDISMYSKLIEVSGTYDDTKKIKLCDDNDKRITTVDMEDFLNEGIKSGDLEKYIEDNRKFIVNSEIDIYIKSMNVSYTEETNNINYISIRAYLLYK